MTQRSKASETEMPTSKATPRIEDFDCVGQASIDARQRELNIRHQDYIAEHPEIGEVLQDLMQALLIHKPDDALAYISCYFKDVHVLPDEPSAPEDQCESGDH